MSRNVARAAPEGAGAPRKPKIGLAAARRMAAAACRVMELVLPDDLSSYGSNLFDAHTAVWVYEAMRDALRKQERRSAAHTREKRSVGTRNQRSRLSSINHSAAPSKRVVT